MEDRKISAQHRVTHNPATDQRVRRKNDDRWSRSIARQGHLCASPQTASRDSTIRAGVPERLSVRSTPGNATPDQGTYQVSTTTPARQTFMFLGGVRAHPRLRARTSARAPASRTRHAGVRALEHARGRVPVRTGQDLTGLDNLAWRAGVLHLAVCVRLSSCAQSWSVPVLSCSVALACAWCARESTAPRFARCLPPLWSLRSRRVARGGGLTIS